MLSSFHILVASQDFLVKTTLLAQHNINYPQNVDPKSFHMKDNTIYRISSTDIEASTSFHVS